MTTAHARLCRELLLTAGTAGLIMNETIWQEVTTDHEREDGGERWLRSIDPKCWVSVLHRRTGFGYMEWETGIVFVHDVDGRPLTYKDRDVLIIAGDRRDELGTMPKEQLRQWYADNIDGNRNSMETIIHALEEARETQ